MRRFLYLEVLQLVRGRAMPLGTVLILAAALLGTQHGRAVIQRQQDAISQSIALQHEQHRAVLNSQPPTSNAGDQLYYMFFHTAHEPSRLAPLSIGQRDVQPFNLKVRLLALHGQLYDGDLVNPLLAAFGNFDLAFVLVLLTPLVLISLCYDVWSSELERGTWILVRSQPTDHLRVLLVKLAVRSTAVLLVSMAAIFAAAMLLKLAVDARLLYILLLAAAYVAVWTGIAGTVIGIGRSSDFNLITLLGLWIFFALLAPAIANVVVTIRYPLPEALELTVKQRQGYHSAWDRPVEETMALFYRHYPEWEGFPVPEDRYSNAWYYAMQQRGDDAAASAADVYFERLGQRSQAMARAAAVMPPVALQLALNSIAQTDLDSHLRYLNSVKAFHEDLKRFFFPVIFTERSIAEVEWAGAPAHRYHDNQSTRVVNAHTFELVAAVVISLTTAWLTLRRRMRSEHVS